MPAALVLSPLAILLILVSGRILDDAASRDGSRFPGILRRLFTMDGCADPPAGDRVLTERLRMQVLMSSVMLRGNYLLCLYPAIASPFYPAPSFAVPRYPCGRFRAPSLRHSCSRIYSSVAAPSAASFSLLLAAAQFYAHPLAAQSPSGPSRSSCMWGLLSRRSEAQYLTTFKLSPATLVTLVPDRMSRSSLRPTLRP